MHLCGPVTLWFDRQKLTSQSERRVENAQIAAFVPGAAFRPINQHPRKKRNAILRAQQHIFACLCFCLSRQREAEERRISRDRTPRCQRAEDNIEARGRKILRSHADDWEGL